jgi:dTDP-4-amino-4,6-dideoxygalactose transaminase
MNGVIYVGGRLVFAGIDSDLNFSFEDIKRRVTSKTKVIVPVHIEGLILTGSLIH